MVKFNELSSEDKDLIRASYKREAKRSVIQKQLSEIFDVSERTIRKWAKHLDLVNPETVTDQFRVMIYDIETSRVKANVWWTGKQYIGHKQLLEEPKVISVSWKWLGEDKIHALTWDENHCDKTMLTKFMKEYNSADLVVGQNNDKFDNRWINARAMKHRIHFNTFVKSFDIMKQTKRLFRLPSYSMDYITKFLNVENKQTHEGIKMWEKIQEGTKAEQKEYLQKMVDYNVGDIVSTEAMYITLRKYMGHKIHFGVLAGKSKWTSPSDGTTDVFLYKTTTTANGTIQRIMQSNTDGVQYKISNQIYMKYLEERV